METNALNTQAIASSPPKSPVTNIPPPVKGRIQGRQCRFYINGQFCPFQGRSSGCWDVHDLEARRVNLAKRNPASATQTQKQEKETNFAARTPDFLTQRSLSATMGDSDAASKLGQKLEDLIITKVTTSDSDETAVNYTDHADAPPPKRTWDTFTDWEGWAVRNLSSRTASKFITPYLPALINGTAPFRIFATGLTAPPIAPGAAAAFPKFGLLPFELRDQIWKCALATEKSDCRITYHYELDSANGHIKNRLVPMNATPRFMHVNSEARAVALKVYEKTFGTEDSPGTCWFNYDADRLFLNTRGSSQYLDVYRFPFPASHCSEKVLTTAF